MPPETALTTISTTPTSLALAPAKLTDKLKELLLSGESPVIGPNSAAELRAWVDTQPVLEPATVEDVDQHIAVLSLASAEKKPTPTEAKARLELYWRVLRGCTRNDLRRGVDKWMRESKWMPKPAELCAAVGLFRARREYALSRARHLIAKHEREWTPPLKPEEMVKPEDLAALKEQLAEQFPSERDAA